jgi:hypothetical protein
LRLRQQVFRTSMSTPRFGIGARTVTVERSAKAPSMSVSALLRFFGITVFVGRVSGDCLAGWLGCGMSCNAPGRLRGAETRRSVVSAAECELMTGRGGEERGCEEISAQYTTPKQNNDVCDKRHARERVGRCLEGKTPGALTRAHDAGVALSRQMTEWLPACLPRAAGKVSVAVRRQVTRAQSVRSYPLRPRL